MRLTRFGHSCLLAESAGARVLFDPGVFSHGFEELTDLDVVVATHQHPDHLDGDRIATLLDGNDGVQVLAEPETAEQLREVGIDATTLHPGEPVTIAGLTLDPVGGIHAEILSDIPRIGNVGVVLRADGEPSVFHPGDSYEAVPEGVDVLALPLNAPWARAQLTVDFVRAVRPGRVVPIHDGLLGPQGRTIYLRVIGQNLPEGTELLDLLDAGPTDL